VTIYSRMFPMFAVTSIDPAKSPLESGGNASKLMPWLEIDQLRDLVTFGMIAACATA